MDVPSQSAAPSPESRSAGLFVELGEMIADLRSIWTTDEDYSSTLRAICRHALTLTESDAAFAFLRCENDLCVKASHGDGAAQLPSSRLRINETTHPVVQAFQLRRTQTSNGSNPAPFPGSAMLVEPIVSGGEAIGVLVLTRREARPYASVDVSRADVIARQASFGASMHRQARELKLIYEVTRTITSSLHLDEVLEFIYQGISQILPTDNFYLALWDGGREIHFEIEIEEGQRLPKRKRLWLSGLTEYLLTTRKSLLIPRDVTGERERLGIALSGRNALCWMGAPMVFRDKAVGVIALQSYDREKVYDEGHLRVLENLAGQAAVAIENARMYQQTRDSLEQLQTTQELLLQSEKLAAVGQLISGIAHELNNPLTGVVGWTQYLMSQQLPVHVARHLTTINEQALRASKIVQNLLTFSRQHKPEQHMVMLNDIIDNTLALRAYELRVNNVAIERRYCADLPAIAADPHQLQQVILNLIINAEQAILLQKSAGTLTVMTENRGDAVRITVADDGPGIAPEMLKKIFDPFFTTKPIGVGTGLGLSISFGIVQEHGGKIWAESTPERGARFIIELPVAQAAVAAPRVEQPPPLPARANQPTVLIVDDEESVRDLLHIVLEESAINVEMAMNGEEALARASNNSYDLIISDLKMPGLSGSEFYQKLHQARGGATPRFVFVTGDVLSGETREFLESTNSFCVLKPFDLNDVRKAVTNALSRSKAAGEGR